MDCGVCSISIIPVRAEPSHRSEMITQLIFGDVYHVIEEQQNWFKVRIAYDDYEGWIDSKQHYFIDENEFCELKKSELNTNTKLFHVILNETKNILFPIVIGSSIPKTKDNSFILGSDTYLFEENILTIEDSDFSSSIRENALLYLNAPYLWGGKTPFGIDCSGFTQMVFKLCNKKIPRDAWQQAQLGENIYFLNQAEVGDLIFFENEKNEIIHTGIFFGENKIIHASGKVRIDIVDENGIYNADVNKYTHKLKIIKRQCRSL